MSLLNIFKKKVEQKTEDRRRLSIWLSGEIPKWTKKNYKALAQAGYRTSMTVFACIQTIAKAFSAVPWKLYESKGNQESEEITHGHPLLTLIHKPNDKQGQTKFMQELISYYLLSGNAYLSIPETSNNQPPIMMWNLRPDRVKYEINHNTGKPRWFNYQIEGKPGSKRVYRLDNILHMKMFDPLNDLYGLSPLEVSAMGIDVLNLSMEWNYKLVKGEGRRPGAFSTEETLTEEQRDDLRKKFREEFSGTESFTTPLVLEGGLKWVEFTLSPKDLDWPGVDRMIVNKVSSVFGVAPELIGHQEQKKFANYKEARKALYEETIIPLLCDIRDDLNLWLVPKFETEGVDLWLDFSEDTIGPIQEAKRELYDRLGNAWWLSINELRRKTGEADLGIEGEVIMIPANKVPLATVSGMSKDDL